MTQHKSGPRSELGRRWAKYVEDMKEYIATKEPALKLRLEKETWELFRLEIARLANSDRKFIEEEYRGDKHDYVDSIMLSFMAKPKNELEALLRKKEEEKNDAQSFRTWVSKRLRWSMQDRLEKRIGQRMRIVSNSDESDEDDEGYPSAVDTREEVDNRILLKETFEILTCLTQNPIDLHVFALNIAHVPRKEAAAELGLEEDEFKTKLETIRKKVKKAVEPKK